MLKDHGIQELITTKGYTPGHLPSEVTNMNGLSLFINVYYYFVVAQQKKESNAIILDVLAI